MDTIAIDGSAHNVQISPDEKVIGVTIVPSEGHAEDSSDSNESMEMEHGEDSDILSNLQTAYGTKQAGGKHI